MLKQVTATRYVEPLHSGGSVPGVVEADDLGTYVVKFTGSAQGRKALVAEVIVGELARALGLRFPELVLVHFDPVIADAEPHEEVRDLHASSAGVNLGMDHLPGARDFTPEAAETFTVDPLEAGRIVARRAHRERRPHRAQLQPAAVAHPRRHPAPAVADRPRRGARLPPPLGRRRPHEGVRLPPPRPRPVRARRARRRRGAGAPGDGGAAAVDRGRGARRLAGRRARVRLARGGPRRVRGPPARAGTGVRCLAAPRLPHGRPDRRGERRPRGTDATGPPGLAQAGARSARPAAVEQDGTVHLR